jgi:hypothetical protein
VRRTRVLVARCRHAPLQSTFRMDYFGMDASRVRRAGADCAVLEPRCTGRSLVEVLIKYAVMNVRPRGSAEKRANPTAVHRFAVPVAACRA